jgi:hypothetical protein
MQSLPIKTTARSCHSISLPIPVWPHIWTRNGRKTRHSIRFTQNPSTPRSILGTPILSFTSGFPGREKVDRLGLLEVTKGVFFFLCFSSWFFSTLVSKKKKKINTTKPFPSTHFFQMEIDPSKNKLPSSSSNNMATPMWLNDNNHINGQSIIPTATDVSLGLREPHDILRAPKQRKPSILSAPATLPPAMPITSIDYTKMAEFVLEQMEKKNFAAPQASKLLQKTTQVLRLFIKRDPALPHEFRQEIETFLDTFMNTPELVGEMK